MERMTLLSFFRTPEFKKLLLRFSIVFLIISILSAAVFFLVDFNLRKEFLRRDMVIAESISNNNYDTPEDVLATINEAYSTSNYTAPVSGFSIKYYSDTYLGFNNITKSYFTIYLLMLIIFSSIIFILSSKSLKKALDETALASQYSSKAMNSSPINDFLPESDEGPLNTLNHNINLLVKRHEKIREALMDEKVFLKNLVSDISHQLKTPLSTLMLNNEMLIKKYPDNKMLTVSQSQLERMEDLVLNLLKYARLEANAVLFNNSRNSVELSIKNAIEAALPTAIERNIEIEFLQDQTIDFIHDGRWLEEAIINILKNAIEHSSKGDKVKIYENSTGIALNISIEDCGNGIPEEELPHIFERFYKGKSSLNPRSIGIGLSLTRLIIEGMGGTVRAENIHGQGARFTISFPLY